MAPKKPQPKTYVPPITSLRKTEVKCKCGFRATFNYDAEVFLSTTCECGKILTNGIKGPVLPPPAVPLDVTKDITAHQTEVIDNWFSMMYAGRA